MNENKYLYVIRSGTSDFIKIGVSNDPESRLYSLQTGSPVPLSIIFKCIGDYRLESVLHKRLEDYKIRGEWYNISEAKLFEHLDSLESIRKEVLPNNLLQARYSNKEHYVYDMKILNDEAQQLKEIWGVGKVSLAVALHRILKEYSKEGNK